MVDEVTADPLVLVAEVDRATDRLLDTVSALAGDDARLPSLLPGWTRGHVLTHVARSADALVNLLTWARTGTPLPAYPSTAARDADIEAGADRPLDDLLADLRASAARFDEAVAAMPAQAWSATVQLRSGAEVPAATLPWQRLREVEVHHVDLAAAYRPEDWPAAFTQRLLVEAAASLGARAETPAMVLRATDLEREVTVGDPADTLTVTGPSYALAAWLTGRRDGTGLTVSPDQPLPVLPQWM
jgi:maleylpyruvate isomerase